jgi:hypothetical protein
MWLDERPEPCGHEFVPAIERQPDTTPISVPPAAQRARYCPVCGHAYNNQEWSDQWCRVCAG